MATAKSWYKKEKMLALGQLFVNEAYFSEVFHVLTVFLFNLAAVGDGGPCRPTVTEDLAAPPAEATTTAWQQTATEAFKLSK